MADKQKVSEHAISVKDWSIIGADISMGGYAMHDRNSANMIGQAAYHFTQALEKSLKSIIRANSEKPNRTSLATHDFDHLLVQTEMCCNGFIAEHGFLADNSQTLSAMNGVRYGDKSVRKGDVYVIMREAQDLYNALTQDLCRETGKSVEELQKLANGVSKDENIFLSLDDSKSAYKSNSKPKGKSVKPEKHNISRDD